MRYFITSGHNTIKRHSTTICLRPAWMSTPSRATKVRRTGSRFSPTLPACQWALRFQRSPTSRIPTLNTRVFRSVSESAWTTPAWYVSLPRGSLSTTRQSSRKTLACRHGENSRAPVRLERVACRVRALQRRNDAKHSELRCAGRGEIGDDQHALSVDVRVNTVRRQVKSRREFDADVEARCRHPHRLTARDRAVLRLPYACVVTAPNS